jgi:aldehyde:ferredoxin oxidoreductase
MFQNLMEAVSSGGSCLFTTYAVFPGMLYSKPNSMVTRIVNKVMPYLGGVIKVANKFPKLLQVNVAALIPHTVAIQAATGIKMSIGNLMVIGARAYNLERLINARLGVDKSWDTLPARLTHEQQIPGNDKTRVPQQKLLKQYYKGRGWDEEGRIKPSTIKYYGLDKLDSIQKRSTG